MLHLCKTTSGKEVVVEAEHDPASHIVFCPTEKKRVVIVHAQPFDPAVHSNPHGAQPLNGTAVVAPAPKPEKK